MTANLKTSGTVTSYSLNGETTKTVTIKSNGKHSIKGVVKMENPTGKLIEFVLENNKSIKVTPNHFMIVKDIFLNKIIELPAFKVKEEESRYLLPCIE